MNEECDVEECWYDIWDWCEVALGCGSDTGWRSGVFGIWDRGDAGSADQWPWKAWLVEPDCALCMAHDLPVWWDEEEGTPIR